MGRKKTHKNMGYGQSRGQGTRTSLRSIARKLGIPFGAFKASHGVFKAEKQKTG